MRPFSSVNPPFQSVADAERQVQIRLDLVLVLQI